MKNLFFILFFSLLSISLFSQSMTHTFHLKNGTLFEGEVIEKMDNGDYLVRTASGNELTIKGTDIKKIVLEESPVNLEDYGGPQAFGFSIFGYGLGFHYRKLLKNDLFFDVGGHYTGTLLIDEATDEIEFGSGLTVSSGVDFFLQRFYKEKKDKIRGNGLFLRAAHTFGDFDATHLSFGWASEYQKASRFNRSFLLHLGLSVSANHWTDDPQNLRYDGSETSIGPFLQLTWVFHQMK